MVTNKLKIEKNEVHNPFDQHNYARNQETER